MLRFSLQCSDSTCQVTGGLCGGQRGGVRPPRRSEVQVTPGGRGTASLGCRSNQGLLAQWLYLWSSICIRAEFR